MMKEEKAWGHRIIQPARKPSKVNIKYPCPGLFRFAGMVGFMVAGIFVYNQAIKLEGLEHFDLLNPVWTAKSAGMAVAVLLCSAVAGLISAAYATTINVRSERINHLFIVLWQFLANGAIPWIIIAGVAMTISVGKQEAKAALVHFGEQRAFLYTAATGCAVSLFQGAVYFFSWIIRLKMITYFILCAGCAVLGAWWNFSIYGIKGEAWVVAGLLHPILLLVACPGMIARDHQQRNVLLEQRNP